MVIEINFLSHIVFTLRLAQLNKPSNVITIMQENLGKVFSGFGIFSMTADSVPYTISVHFNLIHNPWKAPRTILGNKSKSTKMMFHALLLSLSLGSMKVNLCLCLSESFLFYALLYSEQFQLQYDTFAQSQGDIKQ